MAARLQARLVCARVGLVAVVETRRKEGTSRRRQPRCPSEHPSRQRQAPSGDSRKEEEATATPRGGPRACRGMHRATVRQCGAAGLAARVHAGWQATDCRWHRHDEMRGRRRATAMGRRGCGSGRRTRVPRLSALAGGQGAARKRLMACARNGRMAGWLRHGPPVRQRIEARAAQSDPSTRPALGSRVRGRLPSAASDGIREAGGEAGGEAAAQVRAAGAGCETRRRRASVTRGRARAVEGP